MHEILEPLHGYPPECQPTQVQSLGSAGGMSGAQFWRISAPRGTLMLRRWPREHPTPERLQFIHAVLSYTERNGITFIPVPIKTTDGRSFVSHAGHLWELAPWMLGAADYHHSPSPAKLNAALAALAKFHVATAKCGPAPGSAGGQSAVPRHFNRLSKLAHGDTNGLNRAIRNAIWPELAPLAHQFMTAVPSAIPRAIAQLEPLANVALPLQPCLRDIWHDHVLFSGDEVTGLIDFGAIDIDTPATDIARLLGSFVGDDTAGWQAGLEAYAAVRPLSGEEKRAVKALDASGIILAGCNWIRWISIEGREFENQKQVIDRFRRLVARIKEMNVKTA